MATFPTEASVIRPVDAVLADIHDECKPVTAAIYLKARRPSSTPTARLSTSPSSRRRPTARNTSKTTTRRGPTRTDGTASSPSGIPTRGWSPPPIGTVDRLWRGRSGAAPSRSGRRTIFAPRLELLRACVGAQLARAVRGRRPLGGIPYRHTCGAVSRQPVCLAPARHGPGRGARSTGATRSTLTTFADVGQSAGWSLVVASSRGSRPGVGRPEGLALTPAVVEPGAEDNGSGPARRAGAYLPSGSVDGRGHCGWTGFVPRWSEVGQPDRVGCLGHTFVTPARLG